MRLHLTSICFVSVAKVTETTDYRDGVDTPIRGLTESGCGLWLLMVRVTLAGRVWSFLGIGIPINDTAGRIENDKLAIN